MDEQINNPSQTSPSTLPTKPGGANMQQALASRLLPSEALEAAGRLVSAFPNGGGNAGGGYIGALGAILCEYPRIVALKCCDLTKGVARETKFLPTVADIVAFCERETDEMRNSVNRVNRWEEARAAVQRRVDDERQLEAKRKARPTLEELRAKYGPNWGINNGRPKPKTREESRAELIAQIGQKAFDAIPDAGWSWERDGDWVKVEWPPGKMPASEVPK